MNSARIPLFPLDLVLFPGQPLPLHIFEPRYREMTRQCIETQSPFGIVLAREASVARTGCSAIILKTLKTYEDGRSDILTAGQRAFRLAGTHDGKPYLEGDVEYLDEDFSDVDPAISSRLVNIYNRCHNVLYLEDGPRFDTESDSSLVYHVASELPVNTAVRQEILETRSEGERQRMLLAHLEEWYPQLERRERVRGKAAGNGHGGL